MAVEAFQLKEVLCPRGNSIWDQYLDKNICMKACSKVNLLMLRNSMKDCPN